MPVSACACRQTDHPQTVGTLLAEEGSKTVIIIVIETPGFAWRKPKTARPRYSKKLQLKTTTCDVSDYAYRTAAETDASLSDS